MLDDAAMYYTNLDLETVVTPVDAEALEKLCIETNYDPKETEFLVDGFKNSFDLGYRSPMEKIQRKAPNLKLRVGNWTILWNKVIKEVKLGCFVGPFEEPLFKNYIQSLIGLVSKDNSDTRLIFHLSYPRNSQSVNSGTPAEFCSVKYPDFNEAVRLCMWAGINCKIGKK